MIDKIQVPFQSRILRDSQHSIMAEKYKQLLESIDLKDELFMAGINEGLNKFLSNIYIKLNNSHKLYNGDYYSKKALEKIINQDISDLVFEHMIPKKEYIQDKCLFRERSLREEGKHIEESFIKNLLDRYWWIAIITKEENKLLDRNKMPPDWDRSDIFARYNKTNIVLIYYKECLLQQLPHFC